MSNIDTAKISDFLTQLKSVFNWTNPGKNELANNYNKIKENKSRLDELIEKEPEKNKINLKKKLNLIIKIAEPQPPIAATGAPPAPLSAHAQGAPPAPPPAQPKQSAPPSVEATGAPPPSVIASRPSGATAPSVVASNRPSGAAAPSVVASNRPSGAAAPSVAASNRPSGAAAPSVSNKNKKKMEITQKIDFNNYTDFENFFLTEKIKIVNTVATAVLKIENSDNLGKIIFLDLKNITNKLDLKILNIKKKLFINGLKYNNEFGGLLLYSETTTATIFRNGKMTIKTKLEDEKVIREEAKKFADIIYSNSVFENKKNEIVNKKKLRFGDFKIVNVVGAADVMFNVNLEKMANGIYNQYIKYEQEKFSGLVFNCYKPKVTIIIFRTGKIILMGANTTINVKTAFKKILPILCLNR